MTKNTTLSWHHVPGYFDFDDLYDEAVNGASPAGANFVEVGVLFGRSTLYMANSIKLSGKKISFTAVDPLDYPRESVLEVLARHSRDYPNRDEEHLQTLLSANNIGGQREVFSVALTLSGLKDHVRLFRARGQDHAKICKNESLDFVFIDALHTYDDTWSLLKDYLPKVRPGGTIAGHDFLVEPYPDLVRAVKDVLGPVTTRRSSFTWTKPY